MVLDKEYVVRLNVTNGTDTTLTQPADLGRASTMNVSNGVSNNAEETFVKYHEELRGELNNANWHFTIWKYLQ